MKFIVKFVLFILIAVFSSACHKEASLVIDANRIVDVDVECHTFDGSTKTIQLKVLDVTIDSVKKIFSELFKNNFPIYDACCYENRNIVNGATSSLHAYGAAIDINGYINPYYNVQRGTSSILPKRFVNRTKDEKEIRAALEARGMVDESEARFTVSAIMQEPDSDDWYINREISRRGMITPREAKIFEKYGFTIWGGVWRQPMDFMHLQIPRKLAENLASVSKEEGDIIWANHLLIIKWHIILKKKLVNMKKEEGEAMLKDHLSKCQYDGYYLAAADKKETTAICVKDCRRKISYINAVLRRNDRYKNRIHN